MIQKIGHLRAYFPNVRFLAFVLTFLSAFGLPLTAEAQGGAEFIRGRVLNEKGEPIPNVTVTVTGLQSKTERKAKTNKDGLYNTMFIQGDGEYVVTTRVMGYKLQRQRVVRTTNNVLVADVKMATLSGQLDTVRVQADRAVAARKKGEPSVGSNEQDVLTQGALFSLDPSDLRSLMQGTPGLLFLPGSEGLYSALGAPSDQNSTLADGANFTGSRVPSEGIQSATMATSTFDASRGNFAGGQMQITTRSGSNFPEGTLTTSLEDPRMAWQERGAPTPLSRTQTWGGSLTGPIKKNSAFYAFSFETRRQATGLQSLLNLNQALMEQSGLIRDTINAVGSALQSIGVPTTLSGIPGEQLATSGSYLFRADMTPTGTTALTMRVNGSWQRQDGQGIGANSYPATGSATVGNETGGFLSASTYFGKFLNELSLTYGVSKNSGTPYVLLPGGSVQVGALFADGRTGLSSLQFGGNTSGRTRTSNTTLTLGEELSLLTTDSKHQVKGSVQLARTNAKSRAVADQFGTFTYQSLTDLQNNVPATYSRTLSSQDRSSGATTLSFSLGDVWRANDAWNFEYGLRLDRASSDAFVAYNPLVDSVFGRRTDHVPQDIGVSPRFGFSWTQQIKSDPSLGATTADPRMRMAMLRARRFSGMKSPISISGGIGGFKGMLQPGEIASLVDATGLPNTIRQLTCVGLAAPTPLWDQYSTGAAAPDQCLDGTAPVTFSTDKPAVRLYDRSFKSPLSWRANLMLNGLSLKGWYGTISTDYSVGVNNPSQIDLNLRKTSVFTLPTEGRPMYVPADAIVPTTGAIAPGASRIDDRFSTVTNTVSDLKNVNSAITINMGRMNPLFGHLPINFFYTLSHARAQSRGVGLDPFNPVWGPGQQPTHQFSLMTSFPVKWFFISTRIGLSSGTPYTPTVGADLNGDGQGNDPAFVFDPAKVSDPTLSSQLSSLLASSSSARACLNRQLGSIAGVNSCRTGWHLQPDINLGLRSIDPRLTSPGKTFGWQDRLTFSLTTQNALNLLLRGVGLNNTSIGKAAIQPTLDPVLYYVDGFDPNTREFHYRVNQQFGETTRKPYRGHVYQPPFQVTVGARLHLGGAPKVPLVEAFQLVAPEGEPAFTQQQIRERLRTMTSNPVTTILGMRDQILLTEDQVTKLEKLDSAFARKVDTLTAPIADYVADHGRKTDDGQFMRRFSKLRPDMEKAMVEGLKEAAPVLTKEQLDALPPYFQFQLKRASKK